MTFSGRRGRHGKTFKVQFDPFSLPLLVGKWLCCLSVYLSDLFFGYKKIVVLDDLSLDVICWDIMVLIHVVDSVTWKKAFTFVAH